MLLFQLHMNNFSIFIKIFIKIFIVSIQIFNLSMRIKIDTIYWNQGDLTKKSYYYGKRYLDLILFWYFFSILIIVIFCHLSLLCLIMALDGLKLFVSINILQSRKSFPNFFLITYHWSNINPKLMTCQVIWPILYL